MFASGVDLNGDKVKDYGVLDSNGGGEIDNNNY